MASFSNLFSRLLKRHSWRLERISALTYPRDITVRLGYLSEGQAEAVAETIRTGQCFRCRLGKGRWFFGASPSEAIQAALDDSAAKKKRK